MHGHAYTVGMEVELNVDIALWLLLCSCTEHPRVEDSFFVFAGIKLP